MENGLLGSFPVLPVEDKGTEEKPSFSKYGLGYAVDVTTHHPWKNKGPFIARHDDFPDDLNKIEEPCAIEQYHRDIVSGIDISLNVSANITAADTSLIKMGMDAEASRSKAYALHAVGTKIHTSTVRFITDTGSALTYFEEKLQEYVEYDDSIDGGVLKKKCKEFVAKNRCTHYVRALMFGAVDYEVLTHDKYIRIYSAKGEFGIQKFGLSPSLGGGVRRSVTRHQRQGQRLKIGRWDENNKVVEERVIEVEITPVETLVKTPNLSDALTNALKEYRKEKLQELPIGPFWIKCRSAEKPLYILAQIIRWSKGDGHRP